MTNLPSTELVEIQRTSDVLSFTLNNPDQGNQVTGTMFDAMLAALRSESANPIARWEFRYVSGVPRFEDGMTAVAVIGGGSWRAPASYSS